MDGKSARRAFGIDISDWQITFRPPPEANDLDFVILKASQANFGERTFQEFYAAASGIPIRGAYHYFITSRVLPADGQPVKSQIKAGKDKSEKKKGKKPPKSSSQSNSPAELPGFTWQEQADVFLNQVKGKDFAFLALDLEIGGGTDPRTNRKIINRYTRQDVQNIRSWVDDVKRKTGKPVLLYTRATVFNPQILPNGGEILRDLDLWIARYPDDPATAMQGDPYDGDNSVKIPGRRDWRFWQYSDRNNGKGAQYGARTASVDLNVYNGTRQELAEWLGIELVPARIPGVAAPVTPPDAIPVGAIPFGLTETAQPTVPTNLRQLETLRNAGLSPDVHLSIQLGGADLPVLQDLLAALQAAGIAFQQIHITFPIGWEGLASARSKIGDYQPAQAGEAAGEPQIDAGRPDYEGGDEALFIVEIARKAGKRSVLRSFSEKNRRGRPIMEPHGGRRTGDRVTRSAGDRLRVSATHRISDRDLGDGRIRGADGHYYYYVTGSPENGNAAGLYLRKAHTRRL